MNTNQNAKRILCYGDSNTWGANPNQDTRYTINERWTGVLQTILGTDYEVIEEGLRSRTTNVDDPKKPSKNGLTYFRPCLESHWPLDTCIIWLGTNDLKERFNRHADDVAEGCRELIQIAKAVLGSNTKIVLVSPPSILNTETTLNYGFSDSYKESLKLGKSYKKVAQEEDTLFIDLHEEGILPDHAEGVHLSIEMHKKIAQIIADQL